MDKTIKIQFNPKSDFDSGCEIVEVEMLNLNDAVDGRLDEIECQINELDTSIDKLTNHADKADYAVAVVSGIIASLIDTIFVGNWDFKSAKAWSNKEVNEQIIQFAQKDPDYQKYLDHKRSVNADNRLDNAIDFLEKKYKLPGDNEWKNSGAKITANTHHLDDFCHHPTLVGMVCCVIVQFGNDNKSIYSDSTGEMLRLPVTINQYGKFVGHNNVEKIFAGIVNWFVNVAQTIKNRKGHLMSDMAGSTSSAIKGNDGMGLPGSFLSMMKELSSLKCFQQTNFAENLRKAYQNGIGDGKKQVDLGAFNALFEGASSKFDMRTEMAIGSELKRQSIPIVINEILVRACYFTRRLIIELKTHNSVLDVNWNNVIPFNNRTIERMITIATGTFTAIDTLDAVIEGAINSKGNWAEFGRQVVLRLNFVGIGRFTVALGTDAIMGLKKDKKSKERMLLKAESLYLLETKMYYGDKLMWSACKDTNKSISSLFETMQQLTAQIAGDVDSINNSLKEITSIDGREIDKNNQGLNKKLLDIL